MDITIRHNPGFAVARCTLTPGETVRAESGAMMATSADVAIEAKASGGLMKSLKRSVLGGESFFITTYTAPAVGGWVDFAARLPGDAIGLPVSEGLNITRGSYLCSDGSVEIDTSWGGFKNLAGGEGGFLVRASGQGQVVLAAYGAIDAADLGPNESVVVDSGHMVAWDNSVQTQLRRAAGGGLIQSAKSGEGFVFDVRGPGRIWTQSRNPSEFIAWMTSVLPFSRE
ncbi:MAG: TIGR00266 family protein [Nocardioidaceae bacterium]